MRTLLLQIAAALVSILPLTSFAVSSAEMGAELAKKNPRPEGLAGCRCFWELRFNLNEKSSQFSYDLMKRVDDLPMPLRPRLSSTGIDVVRAERDMCNRHREDKFYMKSVAEVETSLVAILAEAAKEDGVSLKCGEPNTESAEKDYCSCPISGVKLGN